MTAWEKYRELERELAKLIGPIKFKRDINLKLGRISQLLELLGNPHQAYRSIHVGGTSGKGSTAVFTANILHEMGYKTGLHVSPHVQLFNERYQINGRLAPTSKLLALLKEMQPAIKAVGETSPYGSVTYFEVQVALAFFYFARENVDVAVVEVGLGGTYDATNVLMSNVAILTNVGLDHVEVLGDTVEKIAADKVGIVKSAGQQVVTAVSQPSVRKIVAERCRSVGATMHLVTVEPDDTFQKVNEKCAKTAVSLLSNKPVPEKESWAIPLPARLELMQEQPDVILDGAHNPDKMAATAQAVYAAHPDKQPIIVFAAKAGKDVGDMLPVLLKKAKCFIASEFVPKGLWQSTKAEGLANMARQQQPNLDIMVESNPQTAVSQALALASPDDLVWITGSLYFAGDAREHWYPLAELAEQAEIGLSGSLTFEK